MKGRVLIISRYFPPGGGVGAYRAAKFAKYLPELGWKPYVVSLPPERQKQFLSENTDEDQYSSIAKIPEERIYIDVPLKKIDQSLGDIRRLPQFAQKIPDIVRDYDIDVVFHTAPPFYSLPNILWTSRRIDSPYIVDLREPWYINEQIFEETKSSNNYIWKYVNKILEQHTLRVADKVIVETKDTETFYKNKYPSIKNKFATITNGYDPDDYKTTYKTEKRATDLQIIHPGKFRDNMQGFISSLKQVNKDKDIILLHFGNEEYKYTKKFYEQSKNVGIRDVIKMYGYTEFEKVIGHVKNSDIGLVVARRNDPTHIPQKTFDYIACDIPILGLGPRGGELDKILKPFENAYLATHEESDKITEILEFFIETKPTTLGSEEERQRYTRKNMTEQLASIFADTI